MRAIVVMFDSLNRKYLPPYEPGCGIVAPNFERLASRAVRFENAYAGSLPCMPARRELHTGRYNFLHRGWGPIEPFDDSVPEMLQRNGVSTHLASDHMHYWEDGGSTYHNRYGTFTHVRGQQGDPWKGWVADPEISVDDPKIGRGETWRQDRINRKYINGYAEYPQTLTFDAGLEFIRDNLAEQDWFVQIETFDPHEPFDSAEQFREIYGAGSDPDLPLYDWPDYQPVVEDRRLQDDVRAHYSALVSQCDHSLGRVLDVMDKNDLWQDTMLVVCTDHGFLLGEQGWWGKTVMPWYDQTVHTPLFMWDPRNAAHDSTCEALVQTMDIPLTLLDFFGVAPTERMQGQSLATTLAGTAAREFGIFGVFGGSIGVTDGRYVYLRAMADPSNEPLDEYTLMPTQIRGFFSERQLAAAELAPGFAFTKNLPVLKTPGFAFSPGYLFGTLLFDLQSDPHQECPLIDDDLELRMARGMVDVMRASEAPATQYVRMGLPEIGEVTAEYLQCRSDAERVSAARAPAPSIDEFPRSRWSLHSRLEELLAHPPAADILEKHCRAIRLAPFGRDAIAGDITLYRAARRLAGSLPWETMHVVADELAQLPESDGIS